MRAAVCREFGRPLSVEELTLAPPQAGEVCVHLKACAICHSDIAAMDGDFGGELPQVLGHEAAGVVAATGDGVDSVAAGERVLVTLLRRCGRCGDCRKQMHCRTPFAIDKKPRLADAAGRSVRAGLRTGAFAEMAVVHESQVIAVDDAIPFDSASLLSCGVITGAGAVNHIADVACGDSVAVIGCGGVGLNCVQAAKLAAADPIVAVDLADNKLTAAMSFGATATLNAGMQNARARAMELSGGAGFDYIFMAAGSARAVEFYLPLLAAGGALVLVGMPPAGDWATVDATEIVEYCRRILGGKMGCARLQTDIPKLENLYKNGLWKLDELITHRFPLCDINTAIDEVRADKALRNVIVF